MDNHLQQEQWSQAGEKAHQLRGIFYLLEAGDLLENLLQIEKMNLALITAPEFRTQLQQQVDAFCAKVEQHIKH